MSKAQIEHVQAWKTADGKTFTDKLDAESHQEAIDTRQKYLSELKGAKVVDIRIEDASADITITFERNGTALVLGIGGAGGDGTTYTEHKLTRVS